MYCIFNREKKLIAIASHEPNHEDLASRGEFAHHHAANEWHTMEDRIFKDGTCQLAPPPPKPSIEDYFDIFSQGRKREGGGRIPDRFRND